MRTSALLAAAIGITMMIGSAPVLGEPMELTIDDYKIVTHPTGERFEPSAVVTSADGTEIFLFNDKTLDLQPTCWAWDGTSLTAMPSEPRGIGIDKIEAATRVDDVIWVLTSCSKPPVIYPDNWRLLAISDPTGPTLEVVDYSIALHGAVIDFMYQHDLPYVKFEGLAASPETGKLILGVRAVGRPPTPSEIAAEEFGPFEEFVVGLLELDTLHPGPFNELLWIDDTTDYLDRPWALSSVDLDRDGETLWITTSYEGNGKKREEVAGRLYQEPVSDLVHYTPDQNLEQFLGVPVALFEGKPEGVCELADGNLFVLFDQDDDRKGGPESTEKYPLTAAQDYYCVLDVGF